MKRARGMTLVELLVAFGIIALAMTTVYNLFIQGAKIWQQSQIKVELQQGALLGTNYLVRELELTTSGSVTVYPDSSNNLTYNGADKDFIGISYISSKDKDGNLKYEESTGTPIWQKFQIIYLDSQNTLRVSKPLYIHGGGTKKLFPLQSIPAGIKLEREEVEVPPGAVFEVDPVRDKVIASNIASFKPEKDGNQVIINLTAAKPNPSSGELFTTSLKTRVTMMLNQGEE